MIKSYSSSLRAQTFLEQALEELDASGPDAALHRIRRMKQLLLRYHEERSRLDQLGLDGIDEVFDVMLAMKQRVDHLQEQVEAYQAAQEKLHAIQDALDVDASAEETVRSIESISEQLEALYEEQELLSRAGVSDATEAVRLIQSMREQLDEVYAGMAAGTSEQPPLGRLEQELGVSDPESVLEIIESMEDQIAAEVEARTDDTEAAATAAGAPSRGAPSTIVHALERQMMAAQTGEANVSDDEMPPLVSTAQLEALADCSPGDLEALDVGVLALDDDARIRLATEHTPLLPGLEGEPEGDTLFERSPAARNPLLQEPLRRGREAGRLDCRFVFAFPRPDAHSPLPLTLHLHRASGSGPTWLFYDRLR
jgi:chemotaxis protein histidine kinase CheA